MSHADLQRTLVRTGDSVAKSTVGNLPCGFSRLFPSSHALGNLFGCKSVGSLVTTRLCQSGRKMTLVPQLGSMAVRGGKRSLGQRPWLLRNMTGGAEPELGRGFGGEASVSSSF